AIPGVRLLHPTEMNEVFVSLPAPVREALGRGGFPVRPRPDDPDAVRFVTAWNTEADDVERFLAAAVMTHAVA
nr:hypothetical protein [Acetobacteraceae bacterium]